MEFAAERRPKLRSVSLSASSAGRKEGVVDWWKLCLGAVGRSVGRGGRGLPAARRRPREVGYPG